MRAAQRSVVTRVYFALLFVVYVAVYPYVGAQNNPNENVRTYMTMALVEGHTLRIDASVARHGWVNDMAKVVDARTGEAHLYSVKGPAVSYLGVPFYWALTRVGPALGLPVPAEDAPAAARERWLRVATFVLRLFAVQLPCFAFLVAFERTLRAATTDEGLRLSAVAAVGLGTNYLTYSHMFASHALSAATAFGSFALATRRLSESAADAPPRSDGRAFAAGLLAGLTTLLDYHALPLTLVLGAYAAFAFGHPRAGRARASALVGLGLAVCAFVLMHFQWCAFGHPLSPGHRESENDDYASLLHQGFFGLGMPSLHAARSLAVSRAFGLFGLSPFLALGVLALPACLLVTAGAASERRPRILATATWTVGMLALWLTVSAAVNWRGGWSIGPRYLCAAPPFFAFGAVTAVELLARARPSTRGVASAVAGGLAIAGVVRVGIVSLFVNSLPEEVTRPLPQIVLPLLRAGLAPYHAGDLVGLTSSASFYAVLAAASAAALLAPLAGVPRRALPARAVVLLLVAALASYSAWTVPAPGPLRAEAETHLAWLLSVWEPRRPAPP